MDFRHLGKIAAVRKRKEGVFFFLFRCVLQRKKPIYLGTFTKVHNDIFDHLALLREKDGRSSQNTGRIITDRKIADSQYGTYIPICGKARLSGQYLF